MLLRKLTAIIGLFILIHCCFFASAQPKKLSNDSLEHYFLSLDMRSRLQKENLELFRKKITDSKGNIFRFFNEDSTAINEAIGINNYAQGYIDAVITKEELTNKLWKNGNTAEALSATPNWNMLKHNIEKKYGAATANRLLIGAQLKWYNIQKDTTNIIRYTVEQVEIFGIDTVGLGRAYANNMIYNLIFMHSKDPAILKKAATWIKMIIDTEPPKPTHYDTYANLLYKLGKTDDAIIWQKKAIELNKKDDPQYQQHLDKMLNGTPTWQ